MVQKLAYEELEQRIRELENEISRCNTMAGEAMGRRLNYEKMLAGISAEAILVDDVNQFEDRCLEIMGRTLDVSRIYIFEHRPETDVLDNTFEWRAPGIPPQKDRLQGIPSGVSPFLMGMMKNNKLISYKDIEDIPDEPLKEILRPQKIKSILIVPLFIQRKYHGFMGFDECRRHRRWHSEDVEVLKTVSQIITGTIEREQALMALRTERAQLLSIFDSLNQYIYVADPETHEILYVNRATRNAYKKELVGGCCYREFQGLESPCRFCTNETIIKQKYAPYHWEYHNPILNRDFMVSDRIIKWTDGKDVRFELAVDITDRKKTEEALKEREDWFRTIFEGSRDAIFITGEDTKFVDSNEAATCLTGYPKEELLKMSIPDLHHADDLHAYEQYFSRIMSDESITSEAKICRKDGKKVDTEFSNRRITIGGIPYMHTVARDLTERRHFVEQLRQAQKMEAIGTLAGGIAHDFNNILSAIVGNAEMALFDVAENHPAQYSIEQIRQAGYRAGDLVKQILAFSRKSEQELRPLHIKLIIKEALKLLRASLPATIQIVQRIDLKTDLILADPTKIHQVMMNLCTNAHHAMFETGGILTVSLSNVDIDSENGANYMDMESGRYVKLAVRDTGHGIAPQIMEKIFDPYFTTKEMEMGTGMGLSVVHGIVKSHGGSVKVESDPGNGATFNAFFPVIESDLIRPSNSPEQIALGNERILYVDDEDALARLGKRMLKRLGYMVTVRTSSIEALELFRAHPERYDLVITDMTMPNMTGDKMAKEILNIRHDIPIILCTGFSELISEKKIKQMGINGFIMKPLVMAEVATAIRIALDRSRAD